jgi:hypothetical protein
LFCNSFAFNDKQLKLLFLLAHRKSKLGNVFGSEQPSSGNQSLQYNRPKQPKKDGSPAKKAADPPAATKSATQPILVALGAYLYK